ncbi:MAG: M48 family metallopeptidase [Chloroflexi bacterium]|nr:M48 family metallopeptidase [Chloroflexota bacterium]
MGSPLRWVQPPRLSSEQPAGTPMDPGDFKAEVLKWAGRIGVATKEVHLRPMKGKWASCSSSGRLSFNLELLAQPAAFRADAIVHELLHLKVPNHGRLFKTLKKAVLSGE